MDARLNVITLGVKDLERSLAFYRDGLGWPLAAHTGDFAIFELGGVALALYPVDLLAEDAGLARGRGAFGGTTLAQNVASREAVDRAVADATAAGARLLRAPSDKEWGGYSGYFADPDGHPWEVAWNPHWRLDARGRLRL